jgi:hypothetical protein
VTESSPGSGGLKNMARPKLAGRRRLRHFLFPGGALES